MTFYFAVEDGTVNKKTGKKGEMGMVVKTTDDMTANEAIQYIETRFPNYAGRMRLITQEEYRRNYGGEIFQRS